MQFNENERKNLQICYIFVSESGNKMLQQPKILRNPKNQIIQLFNYSKKTKNQFSN